jgi:hypothetical protein
VRKSDGFHEVGDDLWLIVCSGCHHDVMEARCDNPKRAGE